MHAKILTEGRGPGARSKVRLGGHTEADSSRLQAPLAGSQPTALSAVLSSAPCERHWVSDCKSSSNNVGAGATRGRHVGPSCDTLYILLAMLARRCVTICAPVAGLYGERLCRLCQSLSSPREGRPTGSLTRVQQQEQRARSTRGAHGVLRQDPWSTALRRAAAS